MQRLSRSFFLASVAGGIGLSFLILLIVTGVRMAPQEPGAGSDLLPLALLPMLYGAVVMMVLIYKMWASIQDGHTRTSPGKAIGFLFIPVFNIYWAFEAIWGFAKDYNSFVERHSIQAGKLPAGLFLTYTILTFAWVPAIVLLGVPMRPGSDPFIQFIQTSGLSVWEAYAGAFGVRFAGIASNYLLGLVLVSKICDAVNAIPQNLSPSATA